MVKEDESVTEKLLNSQNNFTMNNATIENEKAVGSGNGTKGKVADLRLHDAVCDPDNIEEIETLIEEEPHLIFEQDEGRTPLHTVAIDADSAAPDIAKLLLGVTESADGSQLISIERPNLINLQSSANFTALHYAATNRQIELVASLLRWSADPYVQDRKGNTPLHLASQGLKESAIECGKLLLKYDKKGDLINIVNCEEKTALHKAVDERSVMMSKFLLKPENRYDMSLKDSSGRNILHYVCSGTDESDALCDILKAVVSRCGPGHLNAVDIKGRTPLHLAAIQRLPKFVDILVKEDKVNVSAVDEMGKTPLHYACQNGCYPKGHQCVENLITRKFTERSDAVKYLFKNEDKHGHTPFMYACLNCPPSIVQKYMNVVKDPFFWLNGTYSKLLYKHCPLALTGLMDHAFTEDLKRSDDSEDEILVDYGPITGYTDTVEARQETYYLKQALYWDYDAQKEILLHPLTQLFMVRKWSKLRWIIVAWVAWQLIWLGAFTSLIVSFYSHEETRSKPVAIVASFIMLLYILSSVVNEGFEFYTVKLSYLGSLTNVTQVLQNFLSLIAISPVVTGMEEPHAVQKYATATGILLAYILSMRDIGKLHNKIGLVVEVLKQVLIQIVSTIVICGPLLIGFTLAFVVIFDDDEALNSTFPGPIVKVLVMMTGEFEFNDTFKDEGEKSSSVTSNRVVRLLFFLSFLISVPVAFFNLLTGFALDKVMELRERAKVGRIAKQLEHIYFIESILLSLRPLGKIVPMFQYESFMRKLNVTTAWIDQKRQFYTVIRERVRRSERRNLRRKKMQSCMSSFCTGELAKEVEDEIYALATTNSHAHLKIE